VSRDGAAGPQVAKRVDGAGHREREAEQFEQSHRRYALPLLDSVSLQTVVVTTENPTRCGRKPSRDQETPAKNHFMPPKKSAANVALGAAARAMRSERGMPQEAFAGRAGIDRSYYGAIERGEFNVSLDTIMKIAGALEIPAAALLQRARL
jgi:DNA-binding XRE family transcriptional regulator